MGEAFANQPIVIDNGTGVIKAGFAGTEQPKLVFPAYVGRPKHLRVMAGAAEGDIFVGHKAEDLRGILKLNYPSRTGVINDWRDMTHIWNYTYADLGVKKEEHPVLLTEAPLNPKGNRGKAAEIFFETFGVPALYISMQAVLSLYASGRTTGVVLDSGDGVTHAVPIYEGFAMRHAITRVDLAGRDVTQHLQLLLRKECLHLRTSAEFEIVRTIKEQSCYVAQNPTREEQLEVDRNAERGMYVLPDGKQIRIGAARFRAPEVLFAPDLIGEECEGVHEVLMYSISKADMDLRRTLFGNIVLSGGSTLFKGFGERLLLEVKRIAPKDIKIKISAPPERKYSTWLGGSILASLDTFRKMWITKREYEEDPSRVVHKKIFL